MRRLFPLAGLALCLLAACSQAPVPAPTAAPAPMPTASATPQPSGALPQGLDVPQAVEDAAVALIRDEFEAWNTSGGPNSSMTGDARFDDWRIEALEPAANYVGLEGYDIDVYWVVYGIHTPDPDQIRLVGGMELTEDGWLPFRSTYLYFDVGTGAPEYLFPLIENDCQPSSDLFTNDLIDALRAHTGQTVPDQVRAQAEEHLSQGWEDEPLRIDRLEFAGRYPMYEIMVEAYSVAYSRYVTRNGGQEWAAWDEDYYLFFGHTGTDFWLLDLRSVPDGDLHKAAMEAASGLADLEYAFQRDGFPGWAGIGGAGVTITYPSDERTETRHEDWEPIYAEGDYWTTVEWPGLTALMYVSGEEQTISRLETTLTDVSTYRGARVGMSRDEILALYPEASPEPITGFNGDYSGDHLWVGEPYEDWQVLGPCLLFHFDRDTVERIELINFFD